MNLTTKKSRLKGTIAIPGSKSHTIRAVAIASLAEGNSLIRSPLISSDTLSSVSCYKALGAKIDTSDDSVWKVTGTGGNITAPEEIIDVGNSGTTLRIAMGSASLVWPGKSITFTGDEQIRSRPIGPLMEALINLGAHCVSLNSDCKAPVKITGKIAGGSTPIAAFTSQYLSSLLLCTPLALQDSEITVNLLNEPGYVQMTLDWMDKQNIEYENQDMKKFLVKGKQKYSAFDSAIPADFSSATFFLCAAALLGDEVTLLGLDFSDSQPDKAVVDYLKAMGADITIETCHGHPGREAWAGSPSHKVTIKASELQGTEIDMNATPDALPAMAVISAFAKGPTRLVNVPQARTKETDRIACMAKELTKMDVDVEELPDGLVINGGKPKPTQVKGWGDHRIVMALSIAGLMLDGKVTVDTAEAMNVTFPSFVELMAGLGANIELSK
ncbi:MAG: 3-phosphoshikimate 1-carboxyvinyltransferase [Sedimentisphaerales bacterium]|nr:3-phosphoshikimate 1-carboxyvinyltransferase [Sedimentisphaerales bacterium]